MQLLPQTVSLFANKNTSKGFNLVFVFIRYFTSSKFKCFPKFASFYEIGYDDICYVNIERTIMISYVYISL